MKNLMTLLEALIKILLVLAGFGMLILFHIVRFIFMIGFIVLFRIKI